MNQLKTNINENLTTNEKEVIDILLNTINKYSPHTTLRFCGGWVRDKLLGVSSNDIDVMSDNISGEKMAELVIKYLQLKDEPHVIKKNPEKTKNIESAKLYLPLSNGQTQEVDFVQARTDSYDIGVSRNPTVKSGTVTEDAFRRDLTINSLFYNIHTKQVEDKTGQGIMDLMNGIIRTPGDPKERFMEDPLRIFRTIRFAAKYNGNIDSATLNAMKDTNVLSVLHTTSSERIGIEIKKMLINPNPEIALNLLEQTGLMQYIVNNAVKNTKYEGYIKEFNMDQNNPNHKLTLWGHTMQVVAGILNKYKNAEDEKKVTMILSALFHDIGKLYTEIQTKKEGTDKYPNHENGYTSYIGHENESKIIAEYILRFLKLEPYIKQVANLTQYHMRPHQLERQNTSEKALRKFIRLMGKESLNWLDVLNLAISDAYAKDEIVEPEIIKRYQNLEKRLNNALLSLSPNSNSLKIEPILNGNEIMQVLNIKPGKWMKEISEFVEELKDENPNITKDEAIQKLKEKYPQGQEAYDNYPLNFKTASNKSCSIHLLNQKLKDIAILIENNKYFELLTLLEQLKEEYDEDDKIARLIAVNLFKSILYDKSNIRNNLLNYIFNYMEKNFFDSIVGVYGFGILLIIKTNTKEKTINEIGERLFNLSPGLLKSILEMIPKNKVIHKKIYKKFVQKLI